MELKKNTIKHLQEYIEFKIKERGFEDESLHERLLLLTEEIGELIKACRKQSGMYSSDHSKEHSVEKELVDVLNFLFSIAESLHIDLEPAFYEKEAEIDKRVYKRHKSA